MPTRCVLILVRSLAFAAVVVLSGVSAFGSGAALSEDQLESSLGLVNGGLLDVGNGPIGNGSAFQTSFTAAAGQVLSFQFRFLTDENPTDLANVVNDFAFVTLNSGTPTSIADVVDTPLSASNAQLGFALGSSLSTYTTTLATAGTYTLGVGVVNVDDALNPSGLILGNLMLGTTSLPLNSLTLIGNSQLVGTSQVFLNAAVPEPSSIISLGLGGLAVALGVRTRNRRGVA